MSVMSSGTVATSIALPEAVAQQVPQLLGTEGDPARVVFVPVRHHSPACAWALRELLRELQPLTGRRVLVFPGLRSPLRPALLHKAASRRHDPNLRRTHATAATGSVCARPI